MRTLIFSAVLMLIPLASQADEVQPADVSIGVGLSFPEIALVYLSVWPSSTITIDGMLTPSTANGGVTGHIPISASGRHNILVSGMVGFVHALARSSWLPYRGVRFFGGAGYGAQGSWDFRALLGYSGEQTATDTWGAVPTGYLMLGKVF